MNRMMPIVLLLTGILICTAATGDPKGSPLCDYTAVRGDPSNAEIFTIEKFGDDGSTCTMYFESLPTQEFNGYVIRHIVNFDFWSSGEVFKVYPLNLNLQAGESWRFLQLRNYANGNAAVLNALLKPTTDGLKENLDLVLIWYPDSPNPPSEEAVEYRIPLPKGTAVFDFELYWSNYSQGPKLSLYIDSEAGIQNFDYPYLAPPQPSLEYSMGLLDMSAFQEPVEFRISSFATPDDGLFADDFESGDLSRWSSSHLLNSGGLGVVNRGGAGNVMHADIEQAGDRGFVKDESPEAEKSYAAGFTLDLSELNMLTGNAHRIFNAKDGRNDEPVVRLELKKSEGGYQIRAGEQGNDGVVRVTGWMPVSITSSIQVDWWAGDGDGGMVLYLDGQWAAERLNLENDLVQIDYAVMGALAGVDNGTHGRTYFDNFISGR